MDEFRTKAGQKRQVGMLLLSLAVVVGAMLWTWQIGMAANNVEHGLEHTHEYLLELRHNIQQLEAKRK